jgi:RNA polymerase sigma-70 factor (ECF subfamily)
MFRISRNLVLDAAKYREVRRKLENEIPHATSSEDNPDSATEVRMLEEKLAKLVSNLPARCREIFLLSRMEGMSNAEISKQLDLSEKTVENQITRALKILRRHLKR